MMNIIAITKHVSFALLLIALCVLTACAYTAERSLANICNDYTIVAVKVAQEVRIDGVKAANAQRFSKADLEAIDGARTALDEVCPPPEGFDALQTTVDKASRALRLLQAYTPVRGLY